MSVTDRSRARVDETLAELRERYGEFETVERTADLPERAYSETVNRFEREAVVGGAGVWVTDPRDRVLLVRREGSDAWVDPGDAQRDGETVEETALRAVEEQASLEAELTGVLRAEVYEYRARDHRGWSPIHTLNVTFRGEAEGVALAGEGFGAADWWRDTPNRVGYEAMLEFPFPATNG
jgi:ADP-ribose pyrophosphatase YjhB (NUDIX family)